MSFTVPAATQAWESDYPQCVGNAKCHLDLVKVGPAGSDTGDCFTSAGRCEGWFSDPDKASNYECTYGPDGGTQTTLALSECNVYSVTFNAKSQAAGVGYGDPSTGQAPETQPIARPGSAPADGSDTGTDPGSAGSALPGQDGASCFPSGWAAFNPLEWVLKPVKCALVWAFVPSDTETATLRSDVSNSYQSTSLADWMTAIGGFGQINDTSGDSCDGPGATLPELLGGQTIHPFSTCAEPWATVGGATKAVLSLVVIWTCGSSVVRHLASAFGLHLEFGRKETA